MDQKAEREEIEQIARTEGSDGLVREAQQRRSKFGRLLAVGKLRKDRKGLVKLLSKGGMHRDSVMAAADILGEKGDVNGLLEGGTYAGYRHDLSTKMYTVKKLDKLILDGKVDVVQRTDVANRVMLYSKNRKAKAMITGAFAKAGKMDQLNKILEDHERKEY